MTDFLVNATPRTPYIALDRAAGTLVLAGESYPEDALVFYAPLTRALTDYFANYFADYLALAPAKLAIKIKLTYFNSASAGALVALMSWLDTQAETNSTDTGSTENGPTITVDWYCDVDDDIAREFAEDIAADATAMRVNLHDLISEKA